jgi:hypothetical protein
MVLGMLRCQAMWWLNHPELILCNRCRNHQADACIKGDFDSWLGSAVDGDFICLECADKIGLPKEKMIVKCRAIDIPPISSLVQ